MMTDEQLTDWANTLISAAIKSAFIKVERTVAHEIAAKVLHIINTTRCVDVSGATQPPVDGGPPSPQCCRCWAVIEHAVRERLRTDYGVPV